MLLALRLVVGLVGLLVFYGFFVVVVVVVCLFCFVVCLFLLFFDGVAGWLVGCGCFFPLSHPFLLHFVFQIMKHGLNFCTLEQYY